MIEETVELWFIDLRATPADPTEILGAGERQRILKFRSPIEAQRWERTRLALRRVLAGKLDARPEDIEFRTGTYGKPAVYRSAAVPAVHFSVSHSDDWACIAVGNNWPLGVDIECIKPISELGGLGRMVLTTQESAFLEGVPDALKPNAFLRLWARKEAVLKASGLGLNDHFPMNRLSVTEPIVQAPVDESALQQHGWHVCDVAGPPGAVVALATYGLAAIVQARDPQCPAVGAQ